MGIQEPHTVPFPECSRPVSLEANLERGLQHPYFLGLNRQKMGRRTISAQYLLEET